MAQIDGEPRVVPAQLEYLTIYNPTLSDSEESLKQQIVFYQSGGDKRSKTPVSRQEDAPSDKENERLRQVGLAQGMVNFAK